MKQGVIKNDTAASFSSSASSINNGSDSASAYLWLSVPFNNDGSVYMKAEGMYKYDAYLYFTNPVTFVDSQIADIDLLKFAGEFKNDDGNISFSAGRFSISDLTSTIFAQNCDGVFVKYANLSVEVNGYAGYTGLINGNVVSMINSPDLSFNKTQVYSLSPMYVPVNATVSFPALFANQTLSVQAAAFFDLNGTSYNRYYGTLSLTGPFTTSVYYSAFATAGFSTFKSASPELSFLGNAALTIFPSPSLFISVACKVASWDMGFIKPFNGFTSSTLFTGKEFTGCIMPALSVTTSINKANVVISGKGVIGHNGTKLEFEGISADLTMSINIFSDFTFGLTITDSYMAVAGNNTASGTLKLAFSF